jgi:hypothetical protein
MRQVFAFAASAPGFVWLLIIGLANGAAWLAQYYGDLAWVGPLVGFLTIVAVPLLRVWATGDVPAAEARAVAAPPRSALNRWLW